MKIKILVDFTWAHHGVEVVAYAAGAEIETTDSELVEVALREKWAKAVTERQKGAVAAAPENKSA